MLCAYRHVPGGGGDGCARVSLQALERAQGYDRPHGARHRSQVNNVCGTDPTRFRIFGELGVHVIVTSKLLL